MRLGFVAPDERPWLALVESWMACAAIDLLSVSGSGATRWQEPHVTPLGQGSRRVFRADYPTVPSLAGRLEAAAGRPGAALELQEHWVQERGPFSSVLFEHLASLGESYDAVVFVGLAAASTVFGIPLVSQPVVLAPLAEERGFAHRTILRQTLGRADAVLWASEEDRQALRALWPEGRPEAVARGDAHGPWAAAVDAAIAVGRRP